mmetsp:Transcript_72096/g.187686  ORF Transcript_72096/g.187686 Transcript_72096/m.187686 type:complete len:376 (-) Transcript_72096:404-1531(-)
MLHDAADHLAGLRDLALEQGRPGLRLVDPRCQLLDLLGLVIDGAVRLALLQVAPLLVVILLLLLVGQAENHLLDHVHDLVEGAFFVCRDGGRKLLQDLGFHLLGLHAEQLDGALRPPLVLEVRQLQERDRRWRQDWVSWSLGPHARNLRQDFHGHLQRLLLLGPGVAALRPLRLLDAARGLRVRERGLVSREVAGNERVRALGFREVALGLPLLGGLGNLRLPLGLRHCIVRDHGEGVGIQGVRLRRVGGSELVLELHLQLLEELDHAAGLEGVLLDVALVVARGLQDGALLGVSKGLQRLPLLLRHGHRHQRQGRAHLALGRGDETGAALGRGQSIQRVGNALHGVLQSLRLLDIQVVAILAVLVGCPLGEVQG